MAFDHTIDPMTGQPFGLRAQNGKSNSKSALSPLAAATMRKMDDSVADVEQDGRRYGPQSSQSRMPSGAAVHTLRMNSNVSSISDNVDQMSVGEGIDQDVDAERAYRSNHYYNAPSNVSKGRTDVANPNADIWGVSSEPWQDFAQPLASPDRLRPGKVRGGHRLSGESGGSWTASAASSVFDMEAVMTGKKPTPKPKSPSGFEKSSDAPKRSKSLIKKIKSARQNPNVPPMEDDDVELGNLSIGSNKERPG
jgi:hypothetical protein